MLFRSRRVNIKTSNDDGLYKLPEDYAMYVRSESCLLYTSDYSLFDIAGAEIAKSGYIGTFDLGSKAERSEERRVGKECRSYILLPA